MFQAFVLICAASVSYEIDYDTCFRMNDLWGPYRTEENCDIRSNQMREDILRGPLREAAFDIFFMNYGTYPSMMYAEGNCELSNEIES
jgi:hypothetical protein